MPPRTRMNTLVTSAGPLHSASSRHTATCRSASAAATVAWVGVCALVVIAPFEALVPIVSAPGFVVTTVEAAVAVVVGAWLLACLAAGAAARGRTSLTPVWAALVLAWFVAAALAPAHQENALKMSARLAAAFAVFLLAVNGLTSAARLRAFSGVAALAGCVVGALVLADHAGVGLVRQWLTAFRPFVAHVGGLDRPSGPFLYPTIASMYLEVLFALSLPLLMLAIDRGKRVAALLVAAALLTMSHAAASTFTRAGLVTLLAALMLIGWDRYRQAGIDRPVRWAAALAVLVTVQFLGTRPLESMALRLTSEGQEAWYAAWIDAPAQLEFPTGGMRVVPLAVTNAGRMTWDSTLAQPFRLSYHWLTADGRHVVSWEGRRTRFPHAVPPGGRVTLLAEVGAPRQPGRYRLMWDIEQEHRLWFSTEPGALRFFTSATVVGPALGPPATVAPLPRELERESARPGRLHLWRAAARMFGAHPLTGVGPDNFRLQYGAYLGLAEPDARVHSNNMYLEVLAGTGLAGALVGVLFFWRSARCCAALAGPGVPEMRVLGLGVAAAALTIALHGLVDSFLSFTPTYVLFAITLGAAVAARELTHAHANRL